MTKKTLRTKVGKVLYSAPKAFVSKGFLKAFGYSFGSWFCFWGLNWLVTNEAVETLSQVGWAVPLLNMILVYFKQYFDEIKK